MDDKGELFKTINDHINLSIVDFCQKLNNELKKEESNSQQMDVKLLIQAIRISILNVGDQLLKEVKQHG
jgi:hypothetical protein